MFNKGKEIVEYLEENREQIQGSSYYPNDVLTCKDLIKLMDYIILLEAEVDSRTNFYKNTKELYLKTLDRVKQLETNRDEAIKYIENVWYSKNTTNINDIGYTTNKFLKIKEILERGKE